MLNILFISANPRDTSKPLSIEQERQDIDKVFREYKQEVSFENWDGISRKDFMDLMETKKPDIIHFTGHANKEGSPVFLNSNDEGDVISSQIFIEALYLYKNYLKCVILDACYTSLLSEKITESIDCVVGSPGEVKDDESKAFFPLFYKCILNGDDIQEAFKKSTLNLDFNKMEEEVFHLNTKRGLNPSQIRIVRSNENMRLQYCSDFQKNYQVSLIKDLSDLYSYYNVKSRKNVDVRNEKIRKFREFLDHWNTEDEKNRKNILLITGPPGCGKSWLSFSLISDLFSSKSSIFSIRGNKLPIRDQLMDNHNFIPIFIFDDADMTFEKSYDEGRVPAQYINEIMHSCTNLSGPVILSMRKDTWNLLTSEALEGSILLTDDYIENNVEITEISTNDVEAEEVADKVTRSFYEKIQNNIDPSYPFNVEPYIRKQIITKSKNNLVIIRIFFEEMYRIAIDRECYNISIEDLDRIISDPTYYVLSQFFNSYSSDAHDGQLKEDETVEILAGLYHIAKSGSMSIGMLKRMWDKYYYPNGPRHLPKRVRDYLSNLFYRKKPYEYPPTLFDIDKYGAIISFHGSVENTIKQLCDKPSELASSLSQKDELTSGFKSETQRVDQHLNYIKQIQNSIDRRLKNYESEYFKELDKYISEFLKDWANPKTQTISPKVAYYFLSAFKEYVEPQRNFDVRRYRKFKVTFESIFKNIEIGLEQNGGLFSTTVNRLIYYLLENGSYSENSANKGKIGTDDGKLLYQYGTYEDDLDILRERYFKNSDLYSNSIISDDREKLLLFRRVGLALMTIGKINASEKFYEQSYQIAATKKEWNMDAIKIMQLRSELYTLEGRSSESITASNFSINSYMTLLTGAEYITSNDVWGVQSSSMTPLHLIICSLGYQANLLHLEGLDDFADITFQEAEKLLNQYMIVSSDEKKSASTHHLCDLWGIYYADYLLRIRNEISVKLADCITKYNLEYAERNNVTEIISQCNRILGEIRCWYGDNETEGLESTKKYGEAENKFKIALLTARKTSHCPIIIEALLAFGRFKIEKVQWNEARRYLEEANKLCDADSDKDTQLEFYKTYKADVCNALAKTYSVEKSERQKKDYGIG